MGGAILYTFAYTREDLIKQMIFCTTETSSPTGSDAVPGAAAGLPARDPLLPQTGYRHLAGGIRSYTPGKSILLPPLFVSHSLLLPLPLYRQPNYGHFFVRLDGNYKQPPLHQALDGAAANRHS